MAEENGGSEGSHSEAGAKGPRQSAAATVSPPTTLSDVSRLIQLFAEPKTVYFARTGKTVAVNAGDQADPSKMVEKPDPSDLLAIKIRPLNDAEMAEIDRFTDITPPRKSAAPGTSGSLAPGAPDDFDFFDAKYNEQMRLGRRKRRAAVISAGLVELKIEGNSIDEKVAFLEKNFPGRLLNFLRDEIEAISSGEIKALELASFT